MEAFHGSKPGSGIWFYALTLNNYRAFQPLLERIDECTLIASFPDCPDNSTLINHSYRLRWFWLFFMDFTILFFRRPKWSLRYFDLIYNASAQSKLWDSILTIYQPKAIIFANDHSIPSRALMLACKKYKVKTVYIQHATVIQDFPKLDFDLSLLEGNDAKEKYLYSGSDSQKIQMIGMLRLDKLNSKWKKSDQINKVGICLSTQDDLEVFKESLDKLVKAFNFEFEIRPHPRDNRMLTLSKGVRISDPIKENAFDFLNRQDVIIAGNSSIHLEAVLVNVYPIYFQFGNDNYVDSYSYIKNKLVAPVYGISDLIVVLEELKKTGRENVRVRAKWYNEVVETSNEGKSTDLALQYIEELIA